MPRFVILCHSLPSGESHWDFMLESGEVVRTWALSSEPAEDKAIAAKPLPDHRLAYLDYEGPISGDRGHVSRWDAGTFEFEQDDRTKAIVRLRGLKLYGTARLIKESASATWNFTYSD